MIKKIEASFRELFPGGPVIVRSPGRVNIIGEHTDYNEGFVLPAAIDKAVYVAAGKRNDNKIILRSLEFNDVYEGFINEIEPTGNWSGYVLGIVDQLTRRGKAIRGFNLVLDGDVPIGAGMSSSAALECAVVFALNELFDLHLSRIEMVEIAQQAEQTFAGVMVGIMDQFASMFGKKDHVIRLDCRSLDYEYKPLKLNGYKVVLFNTNVKHSLASSAYNTRRQECEQGVMLINKKYSQVKSLRDVTVDILDECISDKNSTVYKRCRFVVEENERLIQACRDLDKGDISALGQRMFHAHEGLSKEYEVSCDELDFLVGAVKTEEAVMGARMMGGGFGGCTINIIREDAIAGIGMRLREKYFNQMNKELTSYTVSIEAGTDRIK